MPTAAAASTARHHASGGRALDPKLVFAVRAVNLVDVSAVRVREPRLTAGPPRAVEAVEEFLGGAMGSPARNAVAYPAITSGFNSART
jgi:hypothetical protein